MLKTTGFSQPLVIAIGVSLLLGIGVGLKIYFDREARLASAIPIPALKILAYKDLFSPELKSAIMTDAGVELSISEVSTPEELWDQLEKRRGSEAPDLVTLFSYQVPLAAQLGWLQAILPRRLVNQDAISPDFIDLPGDPALHQVIPLLWGLTGIAFDSCKHGSLDSWMGVIENAKLKGKVGLPSSTIELLRLSQIEKPSGKAIAAPLTKSLQPWLEGAVLAKDFLSARELIQADSNLEVALASHGEMAFPPFNKWKFQLPREKATLWILSLAMTRDASEEDQAYKFLDAMLKRENAKRLTESAKQASTNRSLEELANFDSRLKPSHLRASPFDQFILWQDFSRAREVRGAIEAAKPR